MLIYLIRHGETTGDVEDRYGGDYDDHLTDKGRGQAEKLARKLKDKDVEIIFASSLIRAQETASILQKKLKVEIKTVKEIRERNLYGILTGMVKSEAKEKYPNLVERLKNTQDTIEGAESWESFVKRIMDSLLEIANMKYQTVAIVTHGGPIRRIFGEFLEIRKEITEIKIADCAYAVLEYKDGKFNLKEKVGIEFVK